MKKVILGMCLIAMSFVGCSKDDANDKIILERECKHERSLTAKGVEICEVETECVESAVLYYVENGGNDTSKPCKITNSFGPPGGPWQFHVVCISGAHYIVKANAQSQILSIVRENETNSEPSGCMWG